LIVDHYDSQPRALATERIECAGNHRHLISRRNEHRDLG
jgi:hypothetical protein